jgi:hypothetical protein
VTSVALATDVSHSFSSRDSALVKARRSLVLTRVNDGFAHVVNSVYQSLLRGSNANPKWWSGDRAAFRCGSGFGFSLEEQATGQSRPKRAVRLDDRVRKQNSAVDGTSKGVDWLCSSSALWLEG